MTFAIHGLAVARGVAMGRAVLVASSRVEVAHYFIEPEAAPAELARLRAARGAALAAHLAAQVGRTRRILTEGPRLGRTEAFTEVALDADAAEGALIDVTIRAHDGARLLA